MVPSIPLTVFICIFICISTVVYIISHYTLAKVDDYRKQVTIPHDKRIKSFLFAYFLKPVLRDIARLNHKIELPKYKSNQKKRLVSAGIIDTLSVDEFMALKELTAITISFILLLLMFNQRSYYLIFLLGLGSFWLPDLWLKDVIKKRHISIIKNLPYFLDIITLSVEAGVDFSGAIAKVVEKGKRTPLRDEFSQMLNETKMGKTRREGLSDMANRVNLPEFTSFVSALIQADQFGAGLGKILRIQSEQIRTKRWQKAEKTASEAPLKMLFPLLIFIFPAVFIIVLVPIALKLIQGGIF